MNGCLVNFDEHKSAVVSYNIKDDFRNVCRVMNIKFFSPTQLMFNDDDSTWFRFADSDWNPIKIQETTNKTDWGYEIKAVPKGALTRIDRKITNTNELASILGVQLVGKPMNLPMNLIGQDLLNICSRARSQSLQLNMNDFQNALFIYFDNTVLISNTLGSIFNDNGKVYEQVSNFIEGTTLFDSRLERRHNVEVIEPNYKTPNDIINSHIGQNILIQSSVSAKLFNVYSINFGDRNLKMVCTKIEMNSDLKPQVFANTFSEII